MPSRTRPQLVASSAYRLASVWGQFEWAGGGTGSDPAAGDAEHTALPNGPVLLVDDLVDSRWTLTIAAKALREAGAEAILPFALALRG